MANEWNNFFDALASGGESFGKGLIMGGVRRDALGTYRKAMDNIDRIVRMSPSNQQPTETVGQDQGAGDFIGQFFEGYKPESGLSENIGNLKPVGSEGLGSGNVVKPYTPPPQTGDISVATNQNGGDDLLSAFINGVADLNKFGEYGAGYIDPLKAKYESKIPKTPKTYRDVVNGYIVITDESGNVLKRTKVGEDKEKDFKIGTDWQVRDNGDGTYSWYEPTETGWIKTKLDASQRDFDAQEKLGDFGKTSRGPSGRRNRGSTKEKDTDEAGQNDVEQTTKKITDLMSLANTRELTGDEKEKLDALQLKVEGNIRSMREKNQERMDINSMPPEDYADRIKQTNDVQGFVNKVLKSWGRSDPASIPPEEWAREILEESWDDEEWNQISAEFQRLTGSPIENYMK